MKGRVGKNPKSCTFSTTDRLQETKQLPKDLERRIIFHTSLHFEAHTELLKDAIMDVGETPCLSDLTWMRMGEIYIEYYETFLHRKDYLALEQGCPGNWLIHHPWRYLRGVMTLRDNV